MNEYEITIPIIYNKCSVLNGYEEATFIEFELDENLQKQFWEICSSGDYREEVSVNITLEYQTEDKNLLLRIQGLKADTERYAYQFAEVIAKEACKKLTMYALQENNNIHHFRTRFSYNPSLVSIKEIYAPVVKREEDDETITLHISDRIKIKEHIEMTLIHLLKKDGLDELWNKVGESDVSKFICDAYYHAAGEDDSRNVYFNLYSVLEYIELNYDEYSEKSPIFEEEEIRILMDSIEENLSEMVAKKQSADERFTAEKRDCVASMIKRDFLRLTYENKAEKLCNIIKNKFGIEEVSCGCVHYKLNKSKIADFIEMRNRLFHSEKRNSSLSEEEVWKKAEEKEQKIAELVV